MVIILDSSHPIVWLVRHVCSDKAEFSFLQKKKKTLFDALSNVYQTGLSDIPVITVIARNRINSVGSLFFPNKILGFGKKYAPKFEKVFEQL